MHALKQAILCVVPRPLINKARDFQGRQRLAALSKENFDASGLRRRDEINLDTMLSNPELAEDWKVDCAAIQQSFGDDDRYGGINPGDRRALYTLIRVLRPARVLEVGTHIGASTLYIARALRANEDDSSVTSVDILDVNAPDGSWNKLGLPMAPVDFAKRLDCADRIDFRTSPSLDFMRTTDETFDFIFLDGDHGPHTVYEEVAAALKVLRPNGIILLHDYYPDARPLFPDGNVISGPFRALCRIGQENPEINAKSLSPLPWETKQGTHATSLALLVRTGVDVPASSASGG